MARKIDGVFQGPDLWSQTDRLKSDVFVADGVHPNRLGAELMAHYWFATLLAHDKLPVPPWSAMPLRPEWRIPEEARIIYDIEYAKTPQKKLLLNLYRTDPFKARHILGGGGGIIRSRDFIRCSITKC
jgi:hypothetical protein